MVQAQSPAFGFGLQPAPFFGLGKRMRGDGAEPRGPARWLMSASAMGGGAATGSVVPDEGKKQSRVE